MSLVSRLGVVLGLDSAEFSAGLGKAESSLNKFGVSSLSAAGGVAAIGTAFVAATASAISFADGINDIAQANDLAVGTVLEFSQALSINGGHAENATKILSSFTTKIDEAVGGSQKTRDSFKELGISIKDLGTLSEENLLRKTIAGLSQMEDPIHRNATAFAIFGKAVKGVDLKGMQDELVAIQGTMDGSDKSFSDIGDSLDRMDRLSRKLKTDLANNIAEPLKIATEAVTNLYEGLGKINSWIESKTDGFNLWDILLPMKGAAKADAKIVEWIQAKRKAMQDDANSGHYTPIDTMVHPDYGSASNPNTRPIAQTPEQIAAAKKLADEYKRQSESLSQQSLEINRQVNAIGLEQTGYEKLLNEFEIGGKYYRLRGTAEEKTILNQQKILDQKNEEYKRAQQIAKQAIALEAEQRAERESRAKEVAQMAINQAKLYQTTTETAKLEKERLDYNTTLVGLSDTQVAKAMALFDIEQEMIKIKKENPFMSQADLDNIKASKVAVVSAQETNTRAQNTFQAGWDKAFANYKEKAMDSATLAADAFNNMTSNMESALDSFVSTGKFSFSSLAQSIIQDLIKIQLKASMMGIFGGGGDGGGILGMFGGGGNFLTSSSTNFANGGGLLGWAKGIFGFADGGSPPVGVPSLVGERGAELFVPRTAGTIIPNNTLSSMMGSQPQTVYNGTVVQNMQAIDTQSATQFLAKNKQAVWSANMSAQRGMPQNR